MKILCTIVVTIVLTTNLNYVSCQISPDKINFVRQGVQRMIFEENQSIPLASLEPTRIIGISSMHPVKHYNKEHSEVMIQNGKLVVQSEKEILEKVRNTGHFSIFRPQFFKIK